MGFMHIAHAKVNMILTTSQIWKLSRLVPPTKKTRLIWIQLAISSLTSYNASSRFRLTIDLDFFSKETVLCPSYEAAIL